MSVANGSLTAVSGSSRNNAAIADAGVCVADSIV
jgi:hypothetical protein